MANYPVISLNAGIGTPLVDTRSDTQKYIALCRQLQNMIPRIYGPVERRPGFRYVANCQYDDVKSRIVPFIFSATIAYDIEFSDQIINIYFQGTLIESDIPSPYLDADLFQLQFGQSADVMWITHQDYAPRKLSRVSVDDFSLDTILFENGPFIKRNDLAKNDDVTIKATGYTIATVTNGTKDTASVTIESTTDISGEFTANKRIYITGATADTIDDAYTVHDTIATTYVGTTVTVYTNETITSDPAVNGEMMVSDATVTLTASSDTFQAGHVGSLFKLTHKRAQAVTKGSATGTGIIGEPIDIKGSFTVTSTGNWGGTFEVQRLADKTNWETYRSYTSVITGGQGSANAQKTDIEESLGVQYRINVTEFDSGILTVTLSANSSTQDSIFKITNYVSATEVEATAIVAAPENTTTIRWYEGSWSDVRGYPTTIVFFEERCIYGFSTLDAQTIWLSGTDDFEDFEKGTNDGDSFALKIGTGNRGRWIGSLDSLAIGTSGSEWRIRSSELDQPLTPTDFSIKEQTIHGSKDIQALAVNEAIIFVDSVARKIREFTFSEPKQKFVSPDLTALAENVTSGGITSMSVQNNPDSIVWFTIANSPYLISMTYERDQNVVAFAEHPVAGNGIVESVSVAPSEAEDIITVTVKIAISGSVERQIWQMQPRDYGADTDIFFVDGGIIDTSGSTAITGLDHLEGETVQVMVDGAHQAGKTVVNGQITIDKAGTRVVVGLPYEYKAEPMRLDNNGTSYGSVKKISEIVLSFYKTLNAEFGDGTRQFPIPWRTTENYDNPPELFTGDKTLTFLGGFTTDTPVVISGTDPFPCILRAIIPKIDQTGR
jgi:hypothetical protein